MVVRLLHARSLPHYSQGTEVGTVWETEGGTPDREEQVPPQDNLGQVRLASIEIIFGTFELCKFIVSPGTAGGIAREVDALDRAILMELVDVCT